MNTADYDALWKADGERLGYRLPPPAARWKRLPVIRFMRAAVLFWRLEAHYANCPIGIRPGYDEWVLYAIGRGWA